MRKTEKTELIDKLSKVLVETQTVYIIDYKGLDVSGQRELKKRLKTVDANFIVAKNTLFKLAGKKAKVSEELLTDSVFSGQNGMVFANEDQIKPLEILAKFADEFD